MAKWVYMFTEGNADMRNLLGGKGANLAEMTNLGLPVRIPVLRFWSVGLCCLNICSVRRKRKITLLLKPA